jgi:hypothetical protein
MKSSHCAPNLGIGDASQPVGRLRCGGGEMGADRLYEQDVGQPVDDYGFAGSACPRLRAEQCERRPQRSGLRCSALIWMR